MSELQELARQALARDPALPAIEYEGIWHDWGAMRAVADGIATQIAQSGAGPRAPIAFIPRNRPSAVAAFVALLAGVHTIRMIYAFQSHGGIARDIRRLQPAVVIAAAEDFTPEILEALEELGAAAIALTEMSATALPGFEKATYPGDPDVADTPQIELLTSGTTGPPKQFAISYETVAKHILGQMRPSSSGPADDAVAPPALLYFPLGNISGLYGTLPSMLNGSSAILLERFTVPRWRDYVLRYRPVRGSLPPVGVQMVLDADLPVEDLSSMKAMFTGAAPVDPTVQKAFEDKYGIPIILSYGATEFGGPVASMTPDLHAEWGSRKIGTVGRPFAGAKLRVVDQDTGEVLPLGSEGVLEVMTPRMGDHWIRTSDIALLDEDGFMFHRGRADGAIMRGGFKLLPETIERALLLHDSIAAAAVIGVADHRLGQVPAAAVQFKPGVVRPDAEELKAHLREHVLSTHIPVHWRFVDALPRTPSLKVDRPGLKRLFEENATA